jgi:hypothetical protein
VETPSRIRDYLIPESAIVEIFGADRRPGCSVSLEGPPESAVLVGVRHDPCRRCFMFRYTDPSFDVVPDGCVVPFWPVYPKVRTSAVVPEGCGEADEASIVLPGARPSHICSGPPFFSLMAS